MLRSLFFPITIISSTGIIYSPDDFLSVSATNALLVSTKKGHCHRNGKLNPRHDRHWEHVGPNTTILLHLQQKHNFRLTLVFRPRSNSTSSSNWSGYRSLVFGYYRMDLFYVSTGFGSSIRKVPRIGNSVLLWVSFFCNATIAFSMLLLSRSMFSTFSRSRL